MTKIGRYSSAVIAVSVWLFVLQTHRATAMDADKHANIEILLEDIGMLANMNRVIDLLVPQVIGSLKKANQTIPDATWDEFTAIFVEEMKRLLPELKEPIIAIYEANFSDEEIKQLVAFYHSSVGHKIVAVLPQLMQQSVAMGQSWGQKAAARAVERIRAAAEQKGYKL
jgi:hypothetical protein